MGDCYLLFNCQEINFCENLAFRKHHINCKVEPAIDIAIISRISLCLEKSEKNPNTADRYGVAVWKNFGLRTALAESQALEKRAFRKYLFFDNILQQNILPKSVKVR